MSNHNIEKQQQYTQEDQENLDEISRKIFQSIDKDNNQELDEHEFMDAITKIAQNLKINTPSKQEILSILQEFDENNDGVLQYNEFKVLIHTLFDDLSAQKPNIKKKQRPRGSFFAQIQDKQISLSSKQFLQLFEISQRQSRVSCSLQKNLEQFDEDVKNVQVPQGYTPEQWHQIVQNQQKQRQDSYNNYIQTKSTDKKYLDYTLIQNNGSVKSVYTCIAPQPQKSPDVSQMAEDNNDSQLKKNSPKLETQKIKNFSEVEQSQNPTSRRNQKTKSKTAFSSNSNSPYNKGKYNRSPKSNKNSKKTQKNCKQIDSFPDSDLLEQIELFKNRDKNESLYKTSNPNSPNKMCKK